MSSANDLHPAPGQAFHMSRVWGSRHGGSIYSRILVEELLRRGWSVALLAETFQEVPDLVRTVELQGFFRRDLFAWPRRARDAFRLFQLIRGAQHPLVIVQGDLPRMIYVLLQWMTPLIFIRQDGILTCPGNNRFLPRDRSVCRRQAGLHCLGMHRAQGCMGRASSLKRIGRLVFRMRDRILMKCIRNFVVSSHYLAEIHGVKARVLYPPRTSQSPPQEGHSPQSRHNATNEAGRPQWQNKSGATPGERERDRRRLVFCGRLETVKGAADAIAIVGLLPKAYRLEMLGEGVDRERLENLAADSGLGARVRFWGWVDVMERDRVLRSAGALLMPSLWDEAFGMAGIEALAQGTPVVAYDVGGVREWCSADVGVLVRCGDIGSAAAAVRALTGDAARWERFSQAAGRTADWQFPAGRFGRELGAILRRANS